MATLAVIGAGAMGLAAAYHALKAGHTVEVFEADDRPGGMAAHFDFDGLSIERYYHFICKADRPTFALLEELGIADTLRWRDTSMGYYIDGRHYRWGDPLALLGFPLLDPLSKLRYGLQMFRTSRMASFDSLETVSARDWIVRGSGRKVYDLLWKRLFELKFYELADDISAAWIATRVKRVGTSRKSLMQEQMGYLEGGSETLVRALVDAIAARGGRIHLSCPTERVECEGGRAVAVHAGGQRHPVDAVICTVPTPFVAGLVPDLTAAEKQAYADIVNIGVACVVMKLKRSVTPHFWLNVNDPRLPVPGIIEFSNLRPTPEPVVYVPYYMPTTNPKWGWSDEALVAEAFQCLRTLNPALAEDDLLASHVGRLRHAQPVCEPGFAARIPPIRTSIANLQVADTSYYYPEDRGIAESVRYGRMMAEAVA
ncbi:NAD(P)/FAD-dependent oxidoreductase [Caenispirillum bisanense]|uniref:UDP-galactopyranose mutase n=1 Tax=Caenispirillum bisanense TaxID=414052 RepID=A0A286GT41_9PROT|nr:NAD(P)/FAD-dependent oxidoreductase [Caenispirillum bisanense]SOD98737.1 UDP-galactopyranose mutase [Caenispirillum bisanense]